MPVRHVKEHPTKRANTNGSKPFSRKFTNIDEIRSSLRSQNQHELVEGVFLLTTAVAAFLILHRSIDDIEESVIQKAG